MKRWGITDDPVVPYNGFGWAVLFWSDGKGGGTGSILTCEVDENGTPKRKGKYGGSLGRDYDFDGKPLEY